MGLKKMPDAKMVKILREALEVSIDQLEENRELLTGQADMNTREVIRMARKALKGER